MARGGGNLRAHGLGSLGRRGGSDSSLSAALQARPPVYESAVSVGALAAGCALPVPLACARYPRAALAPAPPWGRVARGRVARCHRGTPGVQSLAHPAAPTRSHADTHALGACHPGAAGSAPDSPERRRGRVSGRQVSPSETGFLGAPRCPTFLPGIGLPLPFPLPPLSLLLATAAAPLPGLRHFCPRSQAVGWPRSPLPRCAPAACSPSTRARRLSYRRSHPPGEGSGEP